MGVLWLLVVTCFSCGFQNLHAESSGKEPEFSEDTLFIMNSLFGFRPCLDEACGGLPPSHPKVDPTSQDSAGSEYTSKHPPVTPPSPDPVVEYCLPLHSSTVNDISIIEKNHPDIKDIKSKVVEGIIAYVAQFSVLNAKKCEPTVKLLDFILLAVQAMRHSYVGDNGITCNYTEIVDGKPGYPDQTDSPPTTSKCDQSVTPDYTTEADYKPSTSVDCNETVPEVKPTVEPCPEPSEEIEGVIAEDEHDSLYPPFVGSVRGMPGVNYPNYTEVPVTSFSCADKKYIPGFYADLETGCQVFHVCYEHRRESFLCPVGTIFNQPILACDYWYSSNCSLAPVYYEINVKAEEVAKEEEMNTAVGELITVLIEGKQENEEDVGKPPVPQAEVYITKFLPVKAKVTEFIKPVSEMPGLPTPSPQSLEVDEVASEIFNKMVSSATVIASKSRGVLGKIPDPGVKVKLAAVAGGLAAKPVIAAKAKLSAAAAMSVPAAKIAAAKVAAPVIVKTKLATVPLKAAVPVAVKAKIAAAAASVPAAKIVATKAAVPIAVKTKLAVAPKVAVKASAPVLKAKMVASAIPLAKSKIVAPALKGLTLKTVSAPLVKAKVALPLVKSVVAAPVPVVKAKLGAAAAISPLTKKALALGYMKLLKAKKLALVG